MDAAGADNEQVLVAAEHPERRHAAWDAIAGRVSLAVDGLDYEPATGRPEQRGTCSLAERHNRRQLTGRSGCGAE